MHAPDRDWAAFNYTGYRDALVNAGRWPAKTTDRSQFVCQFERSDWRWSDCLLKLYDLPGERIADAGMVGRDFTGWSERDARRSSSTTRAIVPARAPFLDAIKKPERDRGRSAPRVQARAREPDPELQAAHLAVDIPARCEGPAGEAGHAGEPRRKSRFSGIDAESEFCPLPAELRGAGSKLFEDFSFRYSRYVEQVVEPTLLAFKSCTALVVLVDVTMLLAGGVGMYDDNRQIIRDLFDVLSPGENKLFGPLARGLSKVLLPHQWRPGWITRVAFVAPKMDLVHPADRDRMLMLLRRMAERYAADRDGLKYDFFNLSSVVSTKAIAASATAGRACWSALPLRGPDGKKVPPGTEQRFTVSELPDDWPLEWPAGKFTFPEVYPKMPARKDYPPEQVNVDRLATFVIE